MCRQQNVHSLTSRSRCVSSVHANTGAVRVAGEAILGGRAPYVLSGSQCVHPDCVDQHGGFGDRKLKARRLYLCLVERVGNTSLRSLVDHKLESLFAEAIIGPAKISAATGMNAHRYNTSSLNGVGALPCMS